MASPPPTLKPSTPEQKSQENTDNNSAEQFPSLSNSPTTVERENRGKKRDMGERDKDEINPSEMSKGTRRLWKKLRGLVHLLKLEPELVDNPDSRERKSLEDREMREEGRQAQDSVKSLEEEKSEKSDILGKIEGEDPYRDIDMEEIEMALSWPDPKDAKLDI